MMFLTTMVATANITVSSPAVGQAVVVHVTDGERASSGQTIRVIHNPGQANESEEAIGISDGQGETSWTPSVSGVAELRAGDQTTRVFVRVDRVRLRASFFGLAFFMLGLMALYGYPRSRGRT